ncbi:MAG: dTDP-glucose 4,6-dehydratase [Elusimicrobia bacterium]|nr:dTDP-glucose 4,6-dehydratase [Elusimicrobiota bacterium]
MKLLVTGGLGFIGSNFVRHVLKSHPSWRVVNLDIRTYAGNPANLADVAGGLRYRWVRADIRDPHAAAECMRGVDAVVHFAAESHVDRSILDAASFVQTNVVGTHVLLEEARRAAVERFVHVSTDEVYGSVEKGFSREADPLEPNSPYAASKAAADLLVRSYCVTHKLPALITRSSNNFGPYQFPEKALPLLITNFFDDQPFPLYGDGMNVRDWVYVLDHVRALEFLLLKGRTGEVYNIGGMHAAPNKELIERVRKLMGKPASLVQPVPDRPGHDRRYALDCGKLKALGFKHAYPFDEALNLTIAWYRANEAWWRPLKKAGGYRKYYDRQYAARLGRHADPSSAR